MSMARAGIKSRVSYGATDDFRYFLWKSSPHPQYEHYEFLKFGLDASQFDSRHQGIQQRPDGAEKAKCVRGVPA
jgi:hypothetical protein